MRSVPWFSLWFHRQELLAVFLRIQQALGFLRGHLPGLDGLILLVLVVRFFLSG